MSGLPGIRARAAAYSDHGTPGLHAPQDRAELLALLDSVEALMDNPEHYDSQGSSSGYVRVDDLREALGA